MGGGRGAARGSQLAAANTAEHQAAPWKKVWKYPQCGTLTANKFWHCKSCGNEYRGDQHPAPRDGQQQLSREHGGRKGAGASQDTTKPDKHVQKVLDHVQPCSMDEATAHPKWADPPPFDASGMKAFRARCDKKLRVLGNLHVAKKAADSDTEGVKAEISMVTFQNLAMRKPEK